MIRASDKKLRTAWNTSRAVLKAWVQRDFGISYDELRALVGLSLGKAPVKEPERTDHYVLLTMFLRQWVKPRMRVRLEKYIDALGAYLWNDDEQE